MGVLGGGESWAAGQEGGIAEEKADSSCCKGLEERKMRSDLTERRQRDRQDQPPVLGLLTTCAGLGGMWAGPRAWSVDHDLSGAESTSSLPFPPPPMLLLS